jgi:hypothetical protein
VKTVFKGHVARRRGDERSFNDHVIGKGFDEKVFSDHMVRRRGVGKVYAVMWFREEVTPPSLDTQIFEGKGKFSSR